MSNKKNETLKKVFRLTESRKIAVIEPDVTTYQETLGAFMRRCHYTNTFYNLLNCPDNSTTVKAEDQEKAESKAENQEKAKRKTDDVAEELDNAMAQSVDTNNNHEVVNESDTTEFSQLEKLHCKIMALNNDDIQTVVDIVTETDRYELSGDTFNFDLVQLEKATIEKLETFIATCTVHKRECCRSPLPPNDVYHFIPKTELPITIHEVDVEYNDKLEIQVKKIRTDVAKKRNKTAQKVKRAVEAMTMKIVDIEPKRRNRNTDVKVKNESKADRVRCLICGKKTHYTGKFIKYICRRCAKKQRKAMNAEKIKKKLDKMNKIDQCLRCDKKRNGHEDEHSVTQIEPTAVTTFYRLCEALSLCPKKTSCNGLTLI